MGVRHLAKDKSDLVFKERRAYFIWREEGGRERVDCGWSADIMQDEEGAVSDEQGKRRIEEGFSESRNVGICVRRACTGQWSKERGERRCRIFRCELSEILI